ncbi:hypothetical protein BDR06DRAFT_476986 [Suillus hirtellus]|nr:hypothetical protein BDR06DRAFT_476986 [Suillus hirtellus]
MSSRTRSTMIGDACGRREGCCRVWLARYPCLLPCRRLSSTFFQVAVIFSFDLLNAIAVIDGLILHQATVIQYLHLPYDRIGWPHDHVVIRTAPLRISRYDIRYNTGSTRMATVQLYYRNRIRLQ